MQKDAMRTVIPVWAAALVLGIAVVSLAHERAMVLLPIALCVSLMIGFGLELSMPSRPGLVRRLSAAAAGAFIVFALLTVGLLIADPGAIHPR